jgi:poly-gamma-glutamate synthesis protein (capsule biosynthesis protein)
MSSKLRILFTGDVSLTGVYYGRVATGKEILDDSIRQQFAAHDFTVVNLEGPATAAKQVRRSDQDVVSPPNSVDYLADRGINIFNLANNHILDCSLEGFTDTVDAIDARGCHRFGAGFDVAQARQPLFLSRGGVTVALLGVCNFRSTAAGLATPYGSFCDTSFNEVQRVVDEARNNADFVILNYHGGEEYTAVPMPSRRERLRRYAELGIDAIVGHHPHTLQGHERHANCDIFYSLGNFVFDVDVLRTRPLTEKSALLSLQFGDGGIAFEFIPVECDWIQGRVIPGDPRFADHIAAISNFSNYRQIWRRDAYRTYFQRRRPSSPPAQNEPPPPRRRWQKLLQLFKPESYLRLYRQLRNDMVRPIMFAAFEEAIRTFPNRFRRL